MRIKVPRIKQKKNRALVIELFYSPCVKRELKNEIVKICTPWLCVKFGPLKKAMSICQSGWRKILNAFPVIRWVLWGPRTRSSALFRRRSKTELRLRLQHRLRMLQHPITLTRKYSPKFVIKHLRRTNLGSTTLYRILQPKKLLHLF